VGEKIWQDMKNILMTKASTNVLSAHMDMEKETGKVGKQYLATSKDIMKIKKH
jgi:hypothetical protein